MASYSFLMSALQLVFSDGSFSGKPHRRLLGLADTSNTQFNFRAHSLFFAGFYVMLGKGQWFFCSIASCSVPGLMNTCFSVCQCHVRDVRIISAARCTTNKLKGIAGGRLNSRRVSPRHHADDRTLEPIELSDRQGMVGIR